MKRFLILPVMALFFLGIFLVSQPLTAATSDMEILSKKLYLEADLAFKNKSLIKPIIFSRNHCLPILPMLMLFSSKDIYQV